MVEGDKGYDMTGRFEDREVGVGTGEVGTGELRSVVAWDSALRWDGMGT